MGGGATQKNHNSYCSLNNYVQLSTFSPQNQLINYCHPYFTDEEIEAWRG